LLAIVVCAGAGAALNYRINAFGLFGDVRGKVYRSYLNQDREAKYLYSLNYIPSNFNGILVGSSISGNWDTGGIQSARTYNLSSCCFACIRAWFILMAEERHTCSPKTTGPLLAPSSS